MTEVDWLTGNSDPLAMLWELREKMRVTRTKKGRRKLRLFGCGCCQVIRDYWHDPLLAKAVEIAERFAEGQATKVEMEKVNLRLMPLTLGGYLPEHAGAQQRTVAAMAQVTTVLAAFVAAAGVVTFPLPLAGYCGDEQEGNQTIRRILRCVFGNPFRPLGVNKTWLRWNDGTVPKIAQGIYEERAFDRMPILADALLDSGCDNEDLLAHCRSAGPHVRGCWALDLLLGKV
jgi:hypothetical protein